MSNRSVSGAHQSDNSGRGVSASKDSPLQLLSQSLRRAGHQRQPSTAWGDLSKIRPESPPRFQLPVTDTKALLPLGEDALNSRSLPQRPQGKEKPPVRVDAPKDSCSIRYPGSNTASGGGQDQETGIWIDGQVSDPTRVY